MTPVHDVEKQPLHTQPFDRFATVITDAEEEKWLDNYKKNSSERQRSVATPLSIQPSDDKAMILTDGYKENNQPDQHVTILTY